MAHDLDWQASVDRLKKIPGVKVVTFEIGPPITADDRALVEMLNAKGLPKPVVVALGKGNGVKLVWNGEIEGKAVQGSVNILPYSQAAVRAGATEESEPLEGVLWDDEFPAAVKAKLREMVVFEALAGRSAHLAYRLDDAKAALHLVDGDKVAPLVPDFGEVVALLARHAGIDGLRELLTHDDWEKRLAADKQMQAVAKA
jgi:hypothetical protein